MREDDPITELTSAWRLYGEAPDDSLSVGALLLKRMLNAIVTHRETEFMNAEVGLSRQQIAYLEGRRDYLISEIVRGDVRRIAMQGEIDQRIRGQAASERARQDAEDGQKALRSALDRLVHTLDWGSAALDEAWLTDDRTAIYRIEQAARAALDSTQ